MERISAMNLTSSVSCSARMTVAFTEVVRYFAYYFFYFYYFFGNMSFISKGANKSCAA